MNDLLEVLNKVARYDLEDTGKSYYPDKALVQNQFGEKLDAAELAAAFGLKFDMFKGFYKE